MATCSILKLIQGRVYILYFSVSDYIFMPCEESEEKKFFPYPVLPTVSVVMIFLSLVLFKPLLGAHQKEKGTNALIKSSCA